jgi:hypothetical protein
MSLSPANFCGEDCECSEENKYRPHAEAGGKHENGLGNLPHGQEVRK